jgi:hypothetical protein
MVPAASTFALSPLAPSTFAPAKDGLSPPSLLPLFSLKTAVASAVSLPFSFSTKKAVTATAVTAEATAAEVSADADIFFIVSFLFLLKCNSA